MEETKKLELSDGWKKEKGWILDLGDYGTALMEGTGEYLGDGKAVIFLYRYDYKGWIFKNVEVEVDISKPDLEQIGEIEKLDDILICGWDNYTIYPTDKTKVLKRGDPNYIKTTTFDRFIEEVK